MAWISKEYGAFFKELEANNNREWFQENKKRFEQDVKAPFEQFVAAMLEQMREIDPECKTAPKDAIFRIYRDIRFSKDKTPYKTRMSAIIGKGGRKSMSAEGMYLELGHNHLRIYGGVYQPTKEELYAIRQEIRYCAKEFDRLISDKEFVEVYECIRGEKNKRLPAEFAALEETQPLIANKQFYYYADLDPQLMLSDELVSELFKKFEVQRPLRQFLSRAISDVKA